MEKCSKNNSCIVDESGLRLLAHKMGAAIEKIGQPFMLCLKGDLGAGKTTFSQSFVWSFLNDASIDVTSPTFSLIHEYTGHSRTLFHCDFYRIQSPEELIDLGIIDMIDAGIMLIEWPDIVHAFHQYRSLWIELLIEMSGSHQRLLTWSGHKDSVALLETCLA